MRPNLLKLVQTSKPIRELAVFAPVYFFLSLIALRDKLFLTFSWFDGTLVSNHTLLLHFGYTNNEQSRLLQFLIPELFRNLFSLSIPDAYILQRWLFVFLAFVCFHMYLRKWFGTPASFAGVLFLAAIMPLTSLDDLQESSPLLLLTFLIGLWAIRDDNILVLLLASFVGGLNNETMLMIPVVYFFYHFKAARPRELAILVRNTILISLPLVLTVGPIRFLTRDRPVLEDAWHLPDNLQGIFDKHALNFLHLYDDKYWYVFFIFGAFWVYAIISYRRQPRFLQRAFLMVPFFVGAHLITGIISEVRQMLPLSGVLIPMGLFAVFPTEARDPSSVESNGTEEKTPSSSPTQSA